MSVNLAKMICVMNLTGAVDSVSKFAEDQQVSIQKVCWCHVKI